MAGAAATLALPCGSAVRVAFVKNVVVASVAALRCSVASLWVPGSGSGVTVPVTPLGRPDTLKCTGPSEPLRRVTETGTSVCEPCSTGTVCTGPRSAICGTRLSGIS